MVTVLLELISLHIVKVAEYLAARRIENLLPIEPKCRQLDYDDCIRWKFEVL